MYQSKGRRILKDDHHRKFVEWKIGKVLVYIHSYVDLLTNGPHLFRRSTGLLYTE